MFLCAITITIANAIVNVFVCMCVCVHIDMMSICKRAAGEFVRIDMHTRETEKTFTVTRGHLRHMSI